MRILLFSVHYLKLRVGSYLGPHNDHGPLDLKWRWMTWHRIRRAERKYAAAGTFAYLRSDINRIWKMIVS